MYFVASPADEGGTYKRKLKRSIKDFVAVGTNHGILGRAYSC